MLDLETPAKLPKALKLAGDDEYLVTDRRQPPPGPLHVLMTVNSAWNLWNFRRPVIEALLADGHTVTLLAPVDVSVPKLTRLGCRFIPLKMDLKGLNPLRDVMLYRRFRSIFARTRPDVILGYTIKNNLFGAMAARGLGIPFIPNVTGLGTAFLSGGLLKYLAQELYHRAFSGLPVVFFQNDDDRDLFVNDGLIQAGQARLLPGSGIDLARFKSMPYPERHDAPIFLMIARLLRDKGVVEFAEAAKRVRKTHPRARFVLLGAADAANRSAISLATVRDWRASHGIEYVGTCDDVRPHIDAAHCVVLPSYREGAPRTLIEASAMARPVIASNVPGCRSVVDPGETGLFCRPRSGRSLAQVCLRFLEMRPEERRAMGLAGRAKMEREFDQAWVVRAYRVAIAQVVSARAEA